MIKLDISFDVLIGAPNKFCDGYHNVLERYGSDFPEKTNFGVFANKRCFVPHDHHWLRIKNGHQIREIFE